MAQETALAPVLGLKLATVGTKSLPHRLWKLPAPPGPIPGCSGRTGFQRRVSSSRPAGLVHGGGFRRGRATVEDLVILPRVTVWKADPAKVSGPHLQHPLGHRPVGPLKDGQVAAVRLQPPGSRTPSPPRVMSWARQVADHLLEKLNAPDPRTPGL